MKKAITWGVSHITHCFNGMKGFHHREPGALGAALLSEEVTTELVLDGFHAHLAAAKLLINNKKPKNVALITYSVRFNDQPDGIYTFNNRMVQVKDGIVTINENTLAGSTLTLNNAIKNVINQLHLSPIDAAQMASLTPARILGLDRYKGSLEEGKDADIVILNKEFEVEYCINEGNISYKK